MDPIKLQKALGGMNYPAGKEELVKHTAGKEADNVFFARRNLPDRNYETPADVNKELG